MLADRWPPQMEAPSLVDARPGPDVEWVAWVGAATDPEKAPPKPFYIRAPDAKPKMEQIKGGGPRNPARSAPQ
jgi:hypothetical protein